ncbi:hypothetical protein [Dendronalium sp. ChiSLP03b]|uniref:hypothetical protein n=1 Tax=Dendronalium sp. ChiSLP03b TaxID=3075381 RepID=UPI002AD77E19|nr:hypothetical protein [Dendronalium sp. ChiSLP03b]
MTLSIQEKAKIPITPINHGKKHQFPVHGRVKALGPVWVVRVQVAHFCPKLFSLLLEKEVTTPPNTKQRFLLFQALNW